MHGRLTAGLAVSCLKFNFLCFDWDKNDKKMSWKVLNIFLTILEYISAAFSDWAMCLFEDVNIIGYFLLCPLINKRLSWATVATFLDDNFGVFHCFYPPVSNHFVFIPIFTICTTLSTQNMRRTCSANMKLHEHIYH